MPYALCPQPFSFPKKRAITRLRMMAPVLPRFWLTSSADPLALNDKGDNQSHSTDDANSYTPVGRPVSEIQRTGGSGHARHSCRTITAARLEPSQIDSFFE